MTDHISTIKSKVKEFVRKYYLNELYKGFFLFLIITLFVFIVYAILEYYSYLNTSVRLFLFYSFLTLFSLTLVRYILYPLIKILGFGKQLSNKDVAKIVGSHFPEISDKLQNLFELEEMIETGNYKSYDLLLAAIETKEQKIKPFSFIQAIPFKKSLKYVKWALIPIFLFILIISIKSEIITESTERIINYEKHYSPPAPYSFQITNNKLVTFQNSDFLLEFKIIGDEVPENMFIQYGKRSYKCVKIDNRNFQFQFINLQQDVDFQLFSEEIYSENFTLSVLPKPLVISYVMELNYPNYLNKNSEIVENNGDATVPEGTKIVWKIYTKNTDTVSFIFSDQIKLMNKSKDQFSYTLNIRENLDYQIVNKNNFIVNQDTLSYSIFVVKDLYPEISVQSQKDSLFADRIYFKGTIKDDYGFSSLNFVYSKFDADGNLLEENKQIPIEIISNNTIQNYYFFFDASLLELSAGYKVDYHFEVRDNDGVNGAKMAKTEQQTFKIKTLEELEKEIENSSSQSKKDIQQIIDESSQLMKDLDKFNQQLTQKDNLSWQDKQKLDEMINKYNELKKQIEAIQQQNQNTNEKEEQYKSPTEDILKKQNELQKRFDEILSDEMKEMMAKLQQLMQESNKDKIQDAMKNMKQSTEDLNKSLDQQLQMFKYLEYEKKFDELLSDLRKIAQDQKNLSLQTLNKEISKEELIKEQNKINQQFLKLKEDIKSLQKLNNSLEEPNKFNAQQEMQQLIEDQLNEIQNSLSKNQRNKAESGQKSASQQMEKMADEMEQQNNEEELENISEDIETLRQILDNLIQVSFRQESNMTSFSKIKQRSPSANAFIKDQIEIQDLMKLIDDSLNTLARRQIEIKTFVKKESAAIKQYQLLALEQMRGGQFTKAVGNQQFALTSMNNLALMLAESLKSMNKKQSECKGNCNKSGGSSAKKSGKSNKQSKAKSARELQQQLNRQMEALKRSMEQGESPQQGESQNRQSMSEQFAKMAAQQEAIRRMIQEYQNEQKSNSGVGDKSLDQLMQEMEQTERDLVNRIITQQTINRQKNIETRLLESERAEQQRDKEEQRESTEARQRINSTPPKEWNFEKQSVQQIEMIKTIPPSLQYYYKEKVNNYFFNIE